ncbi:metallophosphoesterase family protein [Paenibacillus wynnii]|uniref:metallophosphoesterase family protein n=1 Tax=Paenibacillus wynnii TaxID=268407 RepID=UPI002790E59D|nr:metallophosphoesterase [Paenibacillus wynnii]MDQ0192492.1 3',5'-cyclic AMP phosphodiesterase CpdA [Paenibacillus wynnii]
MTIFLTTDIHYLSKSLTDGGAAFQRDLALGDGKQLRYSEELMKAFAYDVQIQKPDITLISGDLTNNGEKQSHLDMAGHLKAMESSTGTQVYVIPGNHDLLNPWAKSFKGQHQYKTESINPKTFRKIYGPYGYDEALSKDRHSLSYLAAPSAKLWLLMLDTNMYRNNKELRHPQLEGRLSSSTLKWIDKCGELAKQKGATIVGIMHHSLLDHSELMHDGFTIQNTQEVREVLLRNGIASVFSGHIHIQDISSYKQGTEEIYDVANSALSVFPHQFGIMTYSNANHLSDNYHSMGAIGV